MRKRATVQRLELPKGRRVLVVSDVHGNLPFLKGVLAAADFTIDDILILLGDLVEKGPDSLATLRYCMELAKTHAVYPVCGNCDDLIVEFAAADSATKIADFAHYLEAWGARSLLVQMGRAAGADDRTLAELPALRALILQNFAPELAFLRGMPTIIETRDYIFVHGGVQREDRLEGLDAWSCMKNDDFLGQNRAFRRWCIVGHWPVTLYHPRIPSAAPLLEQTRHIASIDGGCCLKVDGQLNALILPETPGGAFTHVAYDGLPTAVALDGQAASDSSVNIRWGKNKVEVLTRGAELCRCRHVDTGRELDILADYLYEKGGITRCEDATDYRLPVAPGDVLSIVHRVTGGCLAKRNGVTGWYFGRLG